MTAMTSPYPILSIIGVLAVALTLAAGLIWLERRLLALWQDRTARIALALLGCFRWWRT